MDHTFLKLLTQLANEQPFEDGSGAHFEIAMHDKAHMLPWNVELEVGHLERKNGPPVEIGRAHV